MNEVVVNLAGPACVAMCAAICGAGCLACVADGTIVIVDAVTGGTALTSGSNTGAAN